MITIKTQEPKLLKDCERGQFYRLAKGYSNWNIGDLLFLPRYTNSAENLSYGNYASEISEILVFPVDVDIIVKNQ